ncbi:MAG: carbohydrate porin [Succinivibrio sp.]
MKKVNLLASAVLASVLAIPSANAVEANFGGFLRTGLQSKNIQNDDGEKAHLGRLGYEPGTYGEIVLGADLANVDDTVWSISSRLGYKAHRNRDWFTAGETAGGSGFAFREFYTSVKGIFDFDKDATVWTGKRYHHRDDTYVNDWRYYDMSGVGVGIDGMSLGQGKLSLAWLRRDESKDYLWDTYLPDEAYKITYTQNREIKSADLKGEGTVNFLDLIYAFPVWDGGNMQLRHTTMIPHRYSDGWMKYAHAKNDYSNAQRYAVDLTQGFSSGFNKTVLIYDHGSNANWAGFGAGTWLDQSGASNKAYRWSLFNFGVVNFTQKFGLAHNVYLTASSGYDENINVISDSNDRTKKSDKSFQVTLRPFYQLTKMTKVELEGAMYVTSTNNYVLNDERKAFKGTEKTVEQGQKLSLAYVISPDASNFFSKPEIQFFVTYLHGNENGIDYSEYGSQNYDVSVNGVKVRSCTKTTNTVIFGAHAEAWW